jgi:hypothetical protein
MKTKECLKMNKWLMRLASLLMVIGFLVGCASESKDQNSTNNNQIEQTQSNSIASEEAEEVVLITITKNHNEELLTEKEAVIEDGALLLDVMKDNFDLEEEGGFITSIDGVEQNLDEEISWMYFVNDEMAMVGAAEYELSAGDKVNFDLQAWE